MTRRRKIALLAVGAVAVAPTALAAPNRTVSVVVNGPTVTWEGGPISGAALTSDVGDIVPCGPGKECDDTLLRTEKSQTTVKISSEDPGSTDLDLYVYRADAQGEPVEFVKSSTGPDANETTSFDAGGESYLVRVVPATATAGTYTGQAKSLPPRPLPGEPDYGTDPSNPGGAGGGGSGSGSALGSDRAPTTTARPPKNSQSRVLRGTARDPDGKIAYVDVALVRLFAKSCKGLRANGSWRKLRKCSAPSFLRAKGTTSWHLTLSKPLAKGLYVVFARATDNLGRAEGGFGKRNRIRFKIT